MSLDYTVQLADFAANASISSISPDFLTLLPVLILDTFSAMLAGAVQPIYRSVVQTVDITYGRNGAFVAIDGTTTSLSGQVFLMGVAAGNFEFEHVIANAHPASAVFPALLCVAAAYHRSGEDLLTATAVDYELATRIGAASTAQVELMGWNAGTIASAMGIAASSSTGLLAFVNTGAMTKRLHPARAGQLGVEAAFLAHAGVAGPPNVLENAEGFLHAFSPSPKPELLIDGLGTTWTASRMILKLSPVHARAQGFVHAVNEYRSWASQNWDASQINNVTIYAGPSVLTPHNWIPRPETLASAQYSVPFGIAAALTVDLRDPLQMNDALVSNSTVASIAAGMNYVQVTNNTHDLGGYMTLGIDGKEVSITANAYPGIPGTEGYFQAAEDKFARVTEALSVSAQCVAVRQLIANVSGLADVSELLNGMVEVGTVPTHKFSSQQ